MIKTYKYRIKDKRVRKALSAHAYAVNQVFNWAVAQHRDLLDRYRAGAPVRKWPSAFTLAAECKGVGQQLGIHQQTVQCALDQFVRARNAHKAQPLRFRSSFGVRRARGWIPFQRQSRHITADSITYLGRRYRIFGAKRRPIPSNAKGGAFVEDALGRWWLTLHVEVEQLAASAGEIGIDLGLKSFAVTSDGQSFESPRSYHALEAKLGVAQRAKNRHRSRAIYIRMANVRRDFHHKLSTRLARDYAFIAVGDVSSKCLAKTRMAKSIYDAGWSAFRQMLAYKAQRYVEVDEKFTTQTCSSCGSLPPERPKGIAGLGIRIWTCSDCGEIHDRDVNAARNIIRSALSAERLVEESRRAS
jgi:IS605 OrfB family transposase